MAITATFGVGWLVDLAYEQYNDQQQTRDVDKLKLMEKMGQSLATTIEQMPEKVAFISQWQQAKSDFQINLFTVAEFPLPTALLEQIKQGESLLLESAEYLTFHYYLASTNELFVLKIPIENFARSNIPVNYLFTLLFYAVLSIVLLLWVYPLVIRLIKLRKTAKKFGEGELGQRIEISRTSYIQDIEQEFNHMAQRIEDLVSDVKLLSSAVSHDLRTPLARIQFGIDTLQEEDNPELRRKYQQKISNNVTEMTALVETLLHYARLDQSMLHMDKHPVDLSSLLLLCIQNVERDGLDIRFETPQKPYVINADVNYLTMLINNLLSNAISYGQGVVLLDLRKQGNSVIFSIADNGHGIDESQRSHLLKPFVRGKHNNVKGHGFGLAIVKRIVDWHDGTMSIGTSAKLSGAQFIIKLPVA
jgi:two-component system OmpR family sensor kinase